MNWNKILTRLTRSVYDKNHRNRNCIAYEDPVPNFLFDFLHLGPIHIYTSRASTNQKAHPTHISGYERQASTDGLSSICPSVYLRLHFYIFNEPSPKYVDRVDVLISGPFADVCLRPSRPDERDGKVRNSLKFWIEKSKSRSIRYEQHNPVVYTIHQWSIQKLW